MLTADDLCPSLGQYVLLADLPIPYRFYRPTADGKIHFNSAIQHFDGGPVLSWGAFLANMLNETAATKAIIKSDSNVVGKFCYTSAA